jgi:hypothetical protein
MINHLTNTAQLDERRDTPHGTAAPPVLLIGGTGKTGRRSPNDSPAMGLQLDRSHAPHHLRSTGMTRRAGRRP